MQVDKISEEVTLLAVKLLEEHDAMAVASVFLSVSQNLFLKELSNEEYTKLMLLALYKTLDLPKN